MRAHPVFRPPAEADSLILRVADGCPHGRCTFCAMYRGVPYRAVPADEWRADLEELARERPDTRRAFLADGDAMALPAAALEEICAALRARLGGLGRIDLYANGSSIARKTDGELARLRAAGLHTLYMGLESGSDAVLARVRKRERADEMVAAARRAQAAGLRMSVMVLAGLGGEELAAEHVARTAEALDRMQPRLLSILSVVPIEGTPYADGIAAGAIRELTQAAMVAQIRELIARLDLRKTVFRANHVSNAVPLEGRLPADRERLLAQLDALLASGMLDATGPGERPLWL